MMKQNLEYFAFKNLIDFYIYLVQVLVLHFLLKFMRFLFQVIINIIFFIEFWFNLVNYYLILLQKFKNFILHYIFCHLHHYYFHYFIFDFYTILYSETILYFFSQNKVLF
jgi:hypothetical protein